MDAKAKVVAWQWRYICLEEWQPCTEEFAQAIKSDVRCETRALIPLTDHEAAMAELQKCFDFANSVILRQDSEIEDAYQKHQTLLTGLEALAGEIEGLIAYGNGSQHGSGMNAAYRDSVDRIRTLASAGLEGKKDGG